MEQCDLKAGTHYIKIREGSESVSCFLCMDIVGTRTFSRSFVLMNISGCTFIFDLSFNLGALCATYCLPAGRIRRPCI
jgi:hypothetical protein